MPRRIDPNDHRARFRGRLLHRSEDKRRGPRRGLLRGPRRGLLRGPRPDAMKPTARLESSIWLRNWRIHRGLTQWQAAQHFAVTAAQISLWERKGVSLHRVKDVYQKLHSDAEAMGFSLDRRPAPAQRERASYANLPADDPWLTFLAYVRGHEAHGYERVRVAHVKAYILDIAAPVTRVRIAWRIAVLMRRLGWDGPKTVRFGARVASGYERAITKT